MKNKIKELQEKKESYIKELKELEVLKKQTTAKISYRKKNIKDLSKEIELLGGGQLSMF